MDSSLPRRKDADIRCRRMRRAQMRESRREYRIHRQYRQRLDGLRRAFLRSAFEAPECLRYLSRKTVIIRYIVC